MNRSTRVAAIAAGLVCTALAHAGGAATVKVTPLGGIDGEFCAQDRALVFEDPDGTRLLYDPGRTVAGATDPRLGKIDIILVSHMHGDHLGNAHNKAHELGQPATSPMSRFRPFPNSNTVEIALAKKSKIVTGSEMPPFFAARLKANGGDPANALLARFGGSVTVGGVRIATVAALHSNGVDPDFIGGELGKADEGGRHRGRRRPGDRLHPALQQRPGDLAVGRHRHPRRPGDGGARLLPREPGGDEHGRRLHDRPGGVGLHHRRARRAGLGDPVARERGRPPPDGKVRAGSRTEAFIRAVRVPVHVPLSGHVMEFDAGGACVAGC